MAATILNSARAVEMSVYVVRAFVSLRELMEVERSLLALDAETRRQFHEVYAAIRALISPGAPKHRPIGFTADL